MLERLNKCKLFSPSNGELIRIETLADQVFAQKMQGDGFAINPSDGKVFSPIKGIVKSIFPTKHAIGVETKNGLECLIHLGIDTVELEGRPFDVLVNEGDKVDKHVQLVNINLQMIEEERKQKTIIVVFPKSIDKIKISKIGKVDNQEEVGLVKLK